MKWLAKFVVFSSLVLTSCSGGGGSESAPNVASISEADCTEEATDGGLLCASNDFGLKNSFSFPNWAGNEYSGDTFKVEEFVSLFSPEAVCAEWDGSNCVLEPAAQQLLDEFDALIKNGRCEGMVVLSERIRSGAIPLTSFSAGADSTLELSPKDPLLLNLINYWWASQFSTTSIRATESFRSLKPSQILSQVKAGLDSGLGYSLGIYSDGSGHAVLPIAIRSMGDGIFEVDAYDSNAVGKLRTLKVDTVSESWTYEFGSRNSSEAAKEWSGGKGSMDLTPMSSREGTLVCDDCLKGKVKGSAPTKVTVNPDGRDDSVALRVITGPGQEVTVVDGVVTKNTNGAVVQLHRNGAGGGFTLLVTETDSDLVMNLSVSDTTTLRAGGALADNFAGDSAAGALVSVSRAGRPRVQMSATTDDGTGQISGGSAFTKLTLENTSDLVTVKSESGASASLSVASEQQLVSLKIEDGQTATLEQIENVTGGTKAINVQVKEGATSLYTSTVADTGQVSSTEVVMNGKVAASSNKVIKDIELDSTKLTSLTDATKSVQYTNGELSKQSVNEVAVGGTKDGVFTQGPVLFESPPGSGKYDVRWGWQGAEAVVTVGISSSTGEGVGVGNGISAAGGFWGSGLSLPAGSYVVRLVASNGQSSASVASIKSSSTTTGISAIVQPGVFTQAPSVFESPPGSGKFDVRWGWSGAESSVAISMRGPDGVSIGSAFGLSAKGGYWGPGFSLAAGDYIVKLLATNGETIAAVSSVKTNSAKSTTTVPESTTTTTDAPGVFTSTPIFFESPAGSGKYDLRWNWLGGAETLKTVILNSDGQDIASTVLTASSKLWSLGLSLSPGTYTVIMRASRGASANSLLTINAAATTTTTTTAAGIILSGPTLVEVPSGSGKYVIRWNWSGGVEQMRTRIADSGDNGLANAVVSSTSEEWAIGVSLDPGTYTLQLSTYRGAYASATVTISPPATTTTTMQVPGVFTGSISIVESPSGSGKYDVFWNWTGTESLVTAQLRDGLGFDQTRSGLSASGGTWGGGFSLVQGRTYTVSLTAANGENTRANISIP